MTEYLSTKETKSFEDDSNVISATYCEETGFASLARCVYRNAHRLVYA